MAAAKVVRPSRGESRATPAITVTRAGVVVGTGFLPAGDVTIRITRRGEEISDYLTYVTDPNGFLFADLPPTALTGILEITATDHRCDPDGPCGRIWSNTDTVSVVDG